MIDLPTPNYEQTIEAIVRCDISPPNIRIKYEDYLRSDEITISDLGPISDEKMRCLTRAVHPFYVLTIADPVQQSALYEFSRREDRPKELADAREWVRSKGMSAKVSAYSAVQNLEIFAAALERACGLKQGSALMESGSSSLVVRPDFLLGTSFKKSAASLECLTKTFAASDATEHGVRLGFIGNEAFVEEEKK